MTQASAERAPGSSAAPEFVSRICAPDRRGRLLAAAILSSALGFIDGTVVAIALPAMRADLGATLPQAQWINNGYMLPLAALILAGGALGDRFGTGRILGLGIFVFVAASLACALAPSPELLITSRIIQGGGAALMVPGSLALIGRAYPPDERGKAIGRWAAASALTTAMGPLIGGLLLQAGPDAVWRLVFAINLPLGVAALWLLYRNIESDPGRPDERLDRVGAVLATLGLGAIAAGLTGTGLWAIVGGVVAVGIFAFWERRYSHPMIPPDLFSYAGFSGANAATFCLYFSLSAILFTLPMTVVPAWGLGEIEAAFAFAPLSFFIFALSSRSGDLAGRIGARPLITGGAILVALGFIALAVVAPSRAYWTAVLPAMSLMGLGMALVVAPLSTAILAAVPQDRSGAASGVNNAVSRCAGLIAVAALGPLASWAYVASDGPFRFGAPGEGVAHAAASAAALSAVSSMAAAAALCAAVLGWFTLPKQ